MSNVFAALPVPAGDGVGAWVDTSSLGPARSITVDGGAFSGNLFVEASNDGAANAVPLSIGPIISGAASAYEITATLQFMRVRRTGSTGGALGSPNVTVGGEVEATAIYGTMDVPTGDGAGAAFDLSAGGPYNTFAVAGPFTGQVLIDVSNDGVNFTSSLLFIAGQAPQTFFGVLASARVRRQFSTGGAAPAISVGSGGSAAGGSVGPNQGLGSQLAWYIVPTATAAFPVRGNDGNDGKTPATALRTRSEFYRRMAGVTLTVSPTVTIASSLLPGDVLLSTIYIAQGLQLVFLGVPTVLFSGVVTAVQPNVPSTNTPYLVTAPPGTGTITGHAQKILENDAGTKRAVIVADGGANQVHCSPPINAASLPVDFVVGDTVVVYDLPSIGGEQDNPTTGVVSYRYLSATRWKESGHRTDLTSCSGNVIGYAGQVNLFNVFSTLAIVVCNCDLFGGYLSILLELGGHITVDTTPVIFNNGVQPALTVDEGVMAFERSAASPLPSLEMNGGVIRVESGGRLVMDVGYVYGTVGGPQLFEFFDEASTIFLAHPPNVTGATTVLFDLAGGSELLSRLPLFQLTDLFGNKLSAGPVGNNLEISRYEICLRDRGLIAETSDPRTLAGATISVSGTVYFTSIGLRLGDVVTNLSIGITTAGAGMTRSRLGLYTAAGVLLAQTADLGAQWQTNGIQTAPLTAPFTVTSSGLYYIAAIAVASVTQPVFQKGEGNTTLPNNTAVGAGFASYQVQLAQADLPNPAVFAAKGAAGFAPWFGVS